MFVLLNKMSFPFWTKSAEFLVEKLSDGFAVTTTSSVADLGQIQSSRNKKSYKFTEQFPIFNIIRTFWIAQIAQDMETRYGNKKTPRNPGK